MPYDTETGEWIEPDEQQPGGQQRSNDEWKALRLAEAKAKRAERENAFLRAGIDPQDPKLKYFAAGYNGALEPDAIKAEAIAAGFMQDPATATPPPNPDGSQPPSQEQVNQQSLEQQQAINQAGGTGATPPPVDPSTLLTDTFAKGGQDAMLAQLAQAGVPIAYEGKVIGGV